MNWLKIGMSEKKKFTFLLLVTGVWLCGVVLFMFKLPSTDDYRQDAIVKDYETVSISNEDTYEQVFHCDVKKLSLISVLMVNNSERIDNGKVVIESYDEMGTLLGRNTHEVNNVKLASFVPNLVTSETDLYGKDITVKVYGEGVDADTPLTLAVKKVDTDEQGYQLNGVENENKLILSYVGKKGNTTYLWFMFMLAAMILPLYVILDYSKILKGKK